MRSPLSFIYIEEVLCFMKIAVDVGHGFVKALSEMGVRVIFPSLICPVPPSVDLGDYARMEAISIDNVPYLVGDPARPHASPLWSRDKAVDEDTLRLILTAVAQLGAVGPAQLATGLPLAWFGSQRKALKEALMGYGGVVQCPGQPPQRLWIEQVKVLPQGVAAASALIAAANYRLGEYVVADIGYRTTDFIVVSKRSDGTIRFDAAQAGSLEIGTHAVASLVAQGLEQEFHLPFQPAEVESVSHVFIDGLEIELGPRRNAAIGAISRQLRAVLTEKLDDQLAKAADMVLCGGGASVLAAAFPRAVIALEPQWGNVQAYLTALRD